MRRQPKVGTCIFCTAQGRLEGEHVIAQWVRNALGVTGNRRQQVRLGPNLEALAGSWRKPIATRQVWCVCRECNRGWMKDLEEAVKPHLAALMRQGAVIIPTAPAARLLAAWALKTAAVAQEMDRNKLKPIDSATCDYLRRMGEPPRGTSVWLVPFREPLLDGLVGIKTFAITPTEIGWLAEVVVGRVGLVVVGPWRGRELPRQPSAVDGTPAIQLWPTAPGILNSTRLVG